MNKTNLQDVNIETGKVEVEVFSQTDAALAHLREKYAVVPSTETDEGYAFVKAGVRELTGYRTKLDAERKRVKQPYLDAGRIIDTEAKRITAELVAIEEPVKAAKKEADDREKRKQEERIARLQKKVDAIAAWVGRAKGSTSSTIAEIIEEVDQINIDDFYDLTSEATRVKNDTLDRLNELYTEKMSAEQAERDRQAAIAEQQKAEAARKELEQAAEIERRINTLRMIPMDLMGKSAAAIRFKIEQLTNYQVPASEFGERAQEAAQAQQQVINQMTMMEQQAAALEQMQAQQAEAEAAKEEAARLEAEQPACQPEQGPAVTDASYQAMQGDDPEYQEAAPVKAFGIDGAFDDEECVATPERVTMACNPELFQRFKDDFDIDTGHIPKHGKGFVTPTATHEGKTYTYDHELVWDYSWGIEEWHENAGCWMLDKEPVGPEFTGMDLRCLIDSFDEREHLEYFFGSERMGDVFRDGDAEYNLEVIVRRVSLK